MAAASTANAAYKSWGGIVIAGKQNLWGVEDAGERARVVRSTCKWRKRERGDRKKERGRSGFNFGFFLLPFLHPLPLEPFKFTFSDCHTKNVNKYISSSLSLRPNITSYAEPTENAARHPLLSF